ncbi:MAG: DoxX family protein [Bacteroidetes bacterium]|nr:DoxX family protein [Bacteroidota bacterium]
METIQTNQPAKTRKSKTVWAGRIISGLCILFLLFDAIMKIIRATSSVKGTTSLGFSDNVVQPIGLLILGFTILYCIPRTAIFGALMLTAHLGGAVAIFVQQFHGNLIFLFPLIFCVLVWTGLFLRDDRLRAIILLRKQEGT